MHNFIRKINFWRRMQASYYYRMMQDAFERWDGFVESRRDSVDPTIRPIWDAEVNEAFEAVDHFRKMYLRYA